MSSSVGNRVPVIQQHDGNAGNNGHIFTVAHNKASIH